jgi:hypothetical protein
MDTELILIIIVLVIVSILTFLTLDLVFKMRQLVTYYSPEKSPPPELLYGDTFFAEKFKSHAKRRRNSK